MIKRKIYIIEHLESKLWEWCLIEYENISKIVGKKNLWFTNIKRRKDKFKLGKFGKVFSKSVSKMNLKNACILDPEATRTLNPSEASKFTYFIFGGILGDYPPKKRTKEELTRYLGGTVRNIGKEQMSTDNAIYTVKQIVDGKNITSLRFKDNVNIKINDFESIDLPYRYNLIKGKPLISKKIINYLKKKNSF